MSMFLVPTDAPGVVIERNVGLGGEAPDEGSHALIHYDGVRRARGAARRRGPGVRHRPDLASAAAASTTPCAPSGWLSRRST
ncbi:MAG: hypothetical protein R2711_11150 [Acidimicrobiales bacterium]